jgi:hypothetical protein
LKGERGGYWRTGNRGAIIVLDLYLFRLIGKQNTFF